MWYLLYCVICIRVRNTIKEVFMANVMEATLANHGVFTRRYTQDAKVTSAQYKKANGIPSHFNNDTNSP
jgi:hypothetical protein